MTTDLIEVCFDRLGADKYQRTSVTNYFITQLADYNNTEMVTGIRTRFYLLMFRIGQLSFFRYDPSLNPAEVRGFNWYKQTKC